MKNTAEQYFVQNFIWKSRRERLLFELTTATRRYDGLSRFCHQSKELLDPARIVLSGTDLERRQDFGRFTEQHNETCLLLSPDPGMYLLSGESRRLGTQEGFREFGIH